MELTQPLHKGLQERPHATVLVCGERRHTFRQFADRVARLAAALQSLGLKPGGRVAMMANNSDRYVEYLYATWWAGGVINPVNVRWSAREVAFSLDDCDTGILLLDEHFCASGAQQRELSRSLQTLVYFGDGAGPDGMANAEAMMARSTPIADARRNGADLAAVLYTGGTTGLPKGVMLTHANLYLNQLSTNMAAARPQESVGLNLAPLFHVGGIGLTLQLMMRLCKQIIMPTFNEVAVLEAIENERASESFMVPTMIKRLIEHPRFAHYDVSSLQLMLYGAAPIDEALLAHALAALPRAGFCQLYGMTELAPVLTVLPAWCHLPDQPAHRRRSAGRPAPIAEVRIVGADGQPLPNGSVGEIAARGPMVMAGYWNQPDQTAAVLRDGWMHTGDGGYMDDDGFVYIVDRLKDMVVTGGENVYSAEVENAITQLPQVSMCAVIGVPDDKWGERVHAVVVLRAGARLSEAAIVAHCRTLIAGYKCPRSMEFRSDLPLSPAGKMLKYKLREQHLARATHHLLDTLEPANVPTT